MYDSINMKCIEQANHRDRKQISVAWEGEKREQRVTTNGCGVWGAIKCAGIGTL